MSTLWTPGGERPIKSERNDQNEASPKARQAMQQDDMSAGDAPDEETLERLRTELANTPASVVVANHCFGLFELAALHLSLDQPQLDEAKVAIDALLAITQGLEGRLGDVEPQLKEGVAQLQMAFVRIRDMAEGTASPKQNQ